MTPALREACARAIHVVRDDGQILRAGRAALYVLARVGHPVLARVLSWIPFVWAIELGYFVVARNRKLFAKMFFKKALPPPEGRPALETTRDVRR